MAEVEPQSVERAPGGVTPPSGTWARYSSAVTAVWLFVSAFLWPHTDAQQANSWVIALLMLGAALTGLNMPAARYANSILAAWLFFSTLLVRSSMTTMWSNIIVATVVFLLSLVPNARRRPPVQRVPPPSHV